MRAVSTGSTHGGPTHGGPTRVGSTTTTGRRWLAAGSLVAAAWSALTAGRALAATQLSPDTCLQQFPLLAPLGVHLDLFIASDACPAGFAVLGHFGRQLAAFAFLAGLALVFAGLASAVVALGGGPWVARTWRSAVAWLRGLLTAGPLTVPINRLPRLAASGPFPTPRPALAFARPQRRGPPLFR